MPISIKSRMLARILAYNLILSTKQLLLLILATLMTGCYSFGPDELRGTHPLYNAAIVDSQNEQFIQNIVRLHYRDPTFFLDVVSVTASLKMDLSAGLDQSAFDLNSGGADILQLSGGAAYTTAPTIAYSPLQGEGFVKSLLRPIAIEDVLRLAGSGWSTRRVFGLCVERMNGLENAPNASGPTPKLSPNHIDPFNRLLQLLDKVAGENLIIPRIDPDTKGMQLEIRSSPLHHDTIWEIKQLLGLDQNLEVYHLDTDFLRHSPDNTISIRSRSLMNILFYVSHNVDTPKAHKAAGLVTVTRNRDGSEFNWDKTAGGSLFHIHQSEKQPDMTFVTIPYRGQWFYLKDNDLESKSTFMLLNQLFRLQAGAAKSAGPTLTLPVR
ncbi:MAG: hypothetical protein WC856_25025 [Methylococcaceae bacterium]